MISIIVPQSSRLVEGKSIDTEWIDLLLLVLKIIF